MSDLAQAQKLARMIKKWRPAGRRMRGEELDRWRQESLRSALQREGLSSHFSEVKHLAADTDDDRLKKSRTASHRAYVKAYGSSRDRSRGYRVVAINERTGRKEHLTVGSLTHREAVTVMSKFTRRTKGAGRHVRIQIEEIG